MTSRHNDPTGIELEAAEWLVRLEDDEADPDEPYPDPLERQRAFFDWLDRSPDRVRVFLETLETECRLRQIDPARRIRIDELLERRSARVIQLYGPRDETSTSPAKRVRPAPKPESQRLGRFVLSGAAALALALVVAWLLSAFLGTTAYATGIGEQRACRLEDGSIVYLNTDSRIEVTFRQRQRTVRLVRGEALFSVEHDSDRPFVVRVGEATIRAVGTRFDVYRREGATDVSVLQGTVQIAAPHRSSGAIPIPLSVTAGEQAEIASGRITARPLRDIADTVSWRERRLVFTDAPLSDVAREFNRYNRTQIEVEGAAGERIHLTGIFDADRPQALVLYARQTESLSVERDRRGWLIRDK